MILKLGITFGIQLLRDREQKKNWKNYATKNAIQTEKAINRIGENTSKTYI